MNVYTFSRVHHHKELVRKSYSVNVLVRQISRVKGEVANGGCFNRPALSLCAIGVLNQLVPKRPCNAATRTVAKCKKEYQNHLKSCMSLMVKNVRMAKTTLVIARKPARDELYSSLRFMNPYILASSNITSYTTPKVFVYKA